MKVKKIIFTTILVLLFILTIISNYYFIIKPKFKYIEKIITDKIYEEFQLKLKIENISFALFNGINLENVKILTPENFEFAYIKNIKIRFKLKKILFEKFDINKSIYKIEFNNYEIKLSDEVLKSNFFKKLFEKSKTKNEPNSIETIKLNGLTKYNSDELNLTIFNPKTEILFLENKASATFTLSPKSIFNIPLDFSFSINAYSTINQNTNSIKLLVYDFKSKNSKIDKNFFIYIKKSSTNLYFNANDDFNNFTSHGEVSSNNLYFYSKFTNFKFLKISINGTNFISTKTNLIFNSYLNILYNKKSNIIINLKSENKKIVLEQLLFKNQNENLLHIFGSILNLQNFNFSGKIFKLLIKNYSLKGIFKIYPNQNSLILSLQNFYINNLLLNNFSISLKYFNKTLSINTIENSESFFISGKIEKNMSNLNLKLNKFKPQKDLNLPTFIKDSTTDGEINLYFSKNKLKIISANISIYNLPEIDSLNLKGSFKNKSGNFDLNFSLNKIFYNNKIIISIPQNNIINFFTHTITTKTNLKGKGQIKILNNNYILSYSISNLLLLNSKLFKNNSLTFDLKTLNKKSKLEINSSFQLKPNLNGFLNFFHKNNSLKLKLTKINDKILFDNIIANYRENNFIGTGFYKIPTKELNLNFNNIIIKGTADFNYASLYLFFNKTKNLKYSKNIKFNLNGMTKIETDFKKIDYIFSNLNFYKIYFNDFLIDEIYFVGKKDKNKFEIEKLNAEINKGKITLKKIKTGENYISAVSKFQNINYKGLNINGEIALKALKKSFWELEFKIEKLFLNNLKLKNLTEKLIIDKNEIYIKNLNKTGFEGKIIYTENLKKCDLNIFFDNQKIGFLNGFQKDKNGSFTLNIEKFDIENASKIFPDIKNSSGEINCNLEIMKNENNFFINGNLNLNDAKFKTKSVIPSADSIFLTLKFQPGSIAIENFTGKIGKGSFKSYGDIELENFKPSEFNIFFETTDKYGIYIAKPESDLMGNIKGKVHITGNLDELNIAGIIFLKDFDFTWPLEKSESTYGFSFIKKINLDIDLIADENVRFFQDANNIDILVKKGGKFHIKGDMSAEHKVVGTMEAEEGSLEYFGTKFNIEYASVTFAPHYTENVPLINAKAYANVKNENGDEFTLTMLVNGRAYNDLTPVLLSSPALSQQEIFYLLNDSTLYIEKKGTNKIIQQNKSEIERLLKIGFVQIFDQSYRNELIAPVERKIKKFLGIDFLKLKSSLVQNLLSYQILPDKNYNTKSFKSSFLSGTGITIGKYITDNILLTYSIEAKNLNIEQENLYYQQLFGVEINILKSLKFEWKYSPTFLYNKYEEIPQQEYILKWRKSVSF